MILSENSSLPYIYFQINRNKNKEVGIKNWNHWAYCFPGTILDLRQAFGWMAKSKKKIKMVGTTLQSNSNPLFTSQNFGCSGKNAILIF